MTIECYLFLCPNHSMHEQGPDEGPFCFQQECTVTARYVRYITQFQATALHNQKLLKTAPLFNVKYSVKPKR